MVVVVLVVCMKEMVLVVMVVEMMVEKVIRVVIFSWEVIVNFRVGVSRVWVRVLVLKSGC